MNNMDIEKKEYLEQLKKKNKEYQDRKKINDNILLKECITALASNANLLEDEEKKNIYKRFKEKIPFLPWGIDWKQFETFKSINKLEQIGDVCVNKIFYIIWNEDLPIIKSELPTIIKHIDDISAVEPDTWLLSTNYDEVIEFYHEGKITFGIVI